MTVILQRYNQQGLPIRKTSEMRPRADIFRQTLLGMRVPQDIIDKIVIIIEFRFIIPDGAVAMLGNYQFHVYLRSQQTWRGTLNEVVAHELKHIAIEILRPKEFRTDGKKKGPYKWEELDCTRAEKKWGKFEYFESLATGENK